MVFMKKDWKQFLKRIKTFDFLMNCNENLINVKWLSKMFINYFKCIDICMYIQKCWN